MRFNLQLMQLRSANQTESFLHSRGKKLFAQRALAISIGLIIFIFKCMSLLNYVNAIADGDGGMQLSGTLTLCPPAVPQRRHTLMSIRLLTPACAHTQILRSFW